MDLSHNAAIAKTLPKSRNGGTVKRLPYEVAAQIRSTAQIIDLTDVVFGLLKNCLDANASSINVSIDFARGSCTIEDNGVGIEPELFHCGGSVDGMHFGSKHEKVDDVNTHGQAGTFLASLAAISLLSITSQRAGDISSHRVLLHRGRVLVRQSPAEAADRIPHGHGTVAVVRDLFGQLPVRIKHRAQQLQSATTLERDWARAVRRTCDLLMAWPLQVTVRIGDARIPSRRCILASSGFPAENTSTQSLTTKDRVMQVTQLLISSHLLASRFRSTFVPVSARSEKYSVTGLISTSPFPNKSMQFLSIGIHPLSETSVGSTYLEKINALFDKSFFDVLEPKEDLGNADARMHQSSKDTQQTLQDLKERRKGIDRWPVFHIHVKPKTDKDIYGMDLVTFNAHIMKLVEAMLQRWLNVNKLSSNKAIGSAALQSGLTGRSRMSQRDVRRMTEYSQAQPISMLSNSKSGSSSGYPSSPQMSEPRRHSQFADWSRIKSSSCKLEDSVWIKDSTATDSMCDSSSSDQTNLTAEDNAPLNNEHHATDDRLSLRKEIGQQTRYPLASPRQDLPGNDLGSTYFSWQDRSTGVNHKIDEHTGTIRMNVQETMRRPSVALQDSDDGRQRLDNSTWFDEVLASWQNPVFAVTEERGTSFQSLSAAPGSVLSYVAKIKMSRDALTRAQVIAQVDCKFILVKMPSQGTAEDIGLVLVDQHAACERVVLEKLMDAAADMHHKCQAEPLLTGPLRVCHGISQLGKPLVFSIAGQESSALARDIPRFRSWGVVYEVRGLSPMSSSFSAECRLTVTHLPELIAERCQQEPRLLIETLRQDALDEDARIDRTRRTADRSAHWIEMMASCPKGISDMLKSRACRSAIMFNDELSVDECDDLMRKLAKCTFPFICAHGRVSMVPLLRLGDTSLADNDRVTEESFRGFSSCHRAGDSSLVEDFAKWTA